LTHIFDKFSEKSKIAKKTTKNPKKNAFWYICIFLAFLMSFQKNLNFQRYFERVQLLTLKFYNHWFFLLSRHWYCSLLKIQKKKRRKSKLTKKKGKERKSWGTIVILAKPHFSYNCHATVKNKKKIHGEKHFEGREQKT
jgi:hypothetical protein